MTVDIKEEILARVPQQHPFRFIDRILEIDSDRIQSQVTFREDAFFYKGHFPGRPITPGVILIEAMAQTAVVSLGLYLVMNEGEETRNYLTVFVDCEAEFHAEVKPGDTCTIKGEKLFWRRRKLKSKAELYLPDGRLAASATLSGMGVPA